MHSLATKLTVAFLAVGLTGALLVALFVRWQTTRQFDRFMVALYGEEIAGLATGLQTYYHRTGSWEGVDGTDVRALGTCSTRLNQPVALADASGRAISGGSPYRVGQKVPPHELQAGMPLQVEGETIGWLLPHDKGNKRPPPDASEQMFLGSVGQATAWSALGAGGLALMMGLFLAQTISRPIHDLTVATQAIARGELGQKVPVRTRDEVGGLASSFNRMSADLTRAVELRHQMTANIAHDLRTPLSALLGYTEALSEGKFEGSPAIYRILHQETQHLQRLVEDLHILSLADAGELSLHFQPTAPRALLERVALAHGAQATTQGITLEVEEGEGLPRLKLDPERMVQVLGNLVRNALRYTPAGGSITLQADRVEEQVRLRVRDTGSGIAPEELPRIWERLYQGNKARSNKGSSGLGLAIARSLVEAHGGTITVESQPGHGAIFTILLPTGAQTTPGGTTRLSPSDPAPRPRR